MKNFSLLSLMAIAALSASIAHAAAEFQQRILYNKGESVGFKEVGPNNWVYCQVKDQDGDLEDPNNWNRLNGNFYERGEDSNGQVNFVIRVSGPSVAGRAAKFGGQNKPKQKPGASPKTPAGYPAAGVAHDDNGDEQDAEAKAQLERQDDLLFPPQDGAEQAAAQPNMLVRALRHLGNAAREATAVAPAHKKVYWIGENEMRWNGDKMCYELFENEGTEEDPAWVQADNKCYILVDFAQDGSANFKALAHKQEKDAEEKEDGASALAAHQSPAEAQAALAGINSGGAEHAFDNAYNSSRGNVLSRAWGHFVSSVNEATAEPAQRQPRSHSVLSGERPQEAVAAVESRIEDVQESRSWHAMVGGWAHDFRDAVNEATAVAHDGGENNGEDEEKLTQEDEVNA